MEGPFNSKRPLEATTTDPSAKRRHFQTASGDAVFRILCPSSKTSSLLLLLGNITGATIRIDDSTPSSEERVLLILSSKRNKDNGADTETTESEESSSKDSRPGQQALVRVFETMVRMDEDKETDSNSNSNGFGFGFAMCCCRLLVGSNQVGSVIGRGGKIVEKIRIDTGAHIRVLPKDHIPSCASPGDELIQITGNFSAVKKALLSVSSCLQDNPRADAGNSSATKPSVGMHHGVAMPSQVDPFPQRGYASGHHAADYHSRGYSFVPGPENIGAAHRMVLEEEVVFKLLCQIEKVGSLIGKGGSIIRALQNETGASIKIADAAPDSDERVVVISARENSEQKHSPAQEAVIRVHCRIAEIGFEPGAAIVGRLLVHSQQIGCLLGKGGFIITEMRRATGASIRIFPKEQVPKCGSPNDEVVQVIGSLQSVQDALFHITSRLRETIFPMKPPPPNFSGPPYLSPFPEIPPPLFRPRHNPASPGNYPSPVGHPHAIDRSAIPSQPLDHQPAFSYGMDRSGPPNMDRVPYPYGGEIPGHGPTFERPSSPRFWAPQAVNSGNHRGTADVLGLASKNGSLGSGNQVSMLTSSTVEITIPQTLLSHVHGENNSNLTQIRQISSAKVVVHDPKPGATEGVVMVSGTPDHVRAAQSLIQAFILCGQTPS